MSGAHFLARQKRPSQRHDLSRRSLLVAGTGLAGAAAVSRVTGLLSPAASAAAGGAPTTADFQDLAASLSGSVVLPSAATYLSALRLFDPIYDGLRPLAVVQPANAADVATTARFASGFATPFAPRSGGHSYVGASGGDQGIQLDLRRLSSVTYNSTTKTVVVGAGASLYAVHTALEPFARTVPTGTCATVAVSGLTLGGGIGFEDRKYGPTCDSLQGVKVVLANGSTVRASAAQNADLFWACRGGGGGNFGVVTEYTFATSAALPVGYATLRWADADLERVIAGWQQRIAAAPPTSFPVLHLTTGSGQVTPKIVVYALGASPTPEVDALVAAIGRTPAARTTTQLSHLQALQQVAGCTGFSDSQCQLEPAGRLTRKVYLAGSDILGRALTATEISAISSYLRARATTSSTTELQLEPFGGAMASKAVGDTAFPWRTALASVQWKVNFSSPPTSSVKTSTYSWITAGHTKFGSASVGAYINYLEPPRPISAYYGSNYTRLRQLRTKYDPNGLFRGKYVIPAG
jgi:FAD/FMN-containing dehydrogenase